MTLFLRGPILAGTMILSMGAAPAFADTANTVTIYKSAQCGCCGGWVDHMRQAGFEVIEKNTDNLAPIKALASVPDDLWSCHTATIGGYVVEGHVPAADVARLLADQPDVKGLGTPGMPSSAPGMDGGTDEPYTVFTFTATGEMTPFAQH